MSRICRTALSFLDSMFKNDNLNNMSILTKKQIIERIKKEEISFTPSLDTFQLQAHSVDLRLGFTFLIPKTWQMTKRGREAITIGHLDKNQPSSFDIIELEQGQHFELLPQEHILVSTLESIKVPRDLMVVLYPRSSTNRRGLSVDLTGIVDSGYEGQLVIPIRNNTHSQIIKLYPGERFCQVVFSRLDESVDPEKSRYHKIDIIEGFKRKKDDEDKKEEIEIKLILKGEIEKLKEKYKYKT